MTDYPVLEDIDLEFLSGLGSQYATLWLGGRREDCVYGELRWDVRKDVPVIVTGRGEYTIQTGDVLVVDAVRGEADPHLVRRSGLG